jgi:hypothetical protein
MDKTDYVPSDGPVTLGTWVYYQGSAHAPGVYTVVAHMDPALYPDFPQSHKREDVYPDGVAYELWPVGVAWKMDRGHLGVLWARRTSFRINIAQDLGLITATEETQA